MIYNFQGGANDGANPQGGVIFVNGTLYGTTTHGGTIDVGTVFELSPPATSGGSWTEQVLYSFKDGLDGAIPYAGLISDGGNLLLGTTYFGGANNLGTIFQVTLTGEETVVHTFAGGTADGAYPIAPLAKAAGGIFGTTTSGGAASNLGTVFKLKLNAAQPMNSVAHVIHRFNGFASGNAAPQSGVFADANGVLYGTAAGDSESSSCIATASTGCGSVYQLAPPAAPGNAWKLKTLHAFKGGNDGSSPWATVLFDTSGNLVGTTSGGGATSECGGYGCGTVFRLRPPVAPATQWHEVILHSFRSDGTDGLYPSGPVFAAANGSYIGLASGGTTATYAPACPNPSGSSGCGMVYEVK